MSDRLLDDIIRLEKALQQQVETERQRSRGWLEQERRLVEQEAGASPEGDNDTMLAEARRTARQQAERRQQVAERRGERLANTPDTVLRAILARHLWRVLPEADDDRTHG